MADEKYMIKIEGQEINVGKEIGGLDDNALRRALTPMFPGAANSRITRAAKDGVTTIEIIKVAGSKGAGRKNRKDKNGGGFAGLCSCKSRRNPMIELFLSLNTEDLNNLDPAQLIGFSGDVEKVIEEGRRQLNQVVAAHTRLTNTTAKDGKAFIPLGF
jgi:hypothetical protein